MRTLSLALVLLAACTTAPAGPTEIPHTGPFIGELVRVERVIDGDTVALGDGSRVRLLCVDTPERGQPGFAEATAFLRDLVEGKDVEIDSDPAHDDKDRWGRLLRLMWVGDRMVNAEIVKAGHSEYWTRYGGSDAMEKALR